MKLPIQSHPEKFNFLHHRCNDSLIGPSKPKAKRGSLGLRECQLMCYENYDLGSSEMKACQDFCLCVYYDKTPFFSCVSDWVDDVMTLPKTPISPLKGVGTGVEFFNA